jgi:coenzyme F420-dependent glucose-6-phosphate dehydrogenase
MTEIGYALSCEEHRPQDLVRNAARAEQVGFTFAGISDHFHPWTDSQGQSPFVWAVLGGIAQSTSRLRLVTGVTCPSVRIHPAIIAQAAATVADMLPGRFWFGVGSGENLNEHILGDHWPPTTTRLDMLDEAIEVIRKLWTGGTITHYGEHYVVENARIYTVPQQLPPILVAASGTSAATLAARIGEGLISTAPQREVLDAFSKAGGNGPRIGQVTVCWAADEDSAVKTAYEVWPNAGIKGQLSQELAMPSMFEEAAQMVKPEELGDKLPCGPDPERHLKAIREYYEAGFDHVYVHQIGSDQAGFFDFYKREVLPRL